MRSFAKYMDGPTVAAEVRLERQKHKGAFLLVEGGTDIRRFERLINEQACSFVNCFGKTNAIEAIELLYDEGFAGALGAVDADFDRVINSLPAHEGLVLSDTHDFDLDAISTTVFEKYTSEVANAEKISAMGGARAFFGQLIESLKPLTMMRFANEKHALGYSFKSLNVENFYDGAKIDIDRMIEDVSWGNLDTPQSKITLKSHIDRYSGSNIDLIQATSGHDFCAALGLSLRAIIGDRKQPQTWRSEIELHVRLAFDAQHFAETGACATILDWQKANSPFCILR